LASLAPRQKKIPTTKNKPKKYLIIRGGRPRHHHSRHNEGTFGNICLEKSLEDKNRKLYIIFSIYFSGRVINFLYTFWGKGHVNQFFENKKKIQGVKEFSYEMDLVLCNGDFFLENCQVITEPVCNPTFNFCSKKSVMYSEHFPPASFLSGSSQEHILLRAVFYCMSVIVVNY